MAATRFTGSALDRRIQLLRPAPTRDPAFGAAVPAWDIVATVAAKRLEEPGTTSTSADQRVASRSVQFLLRYRADVQAGWRVVEGARRFRIVGHPAEQGRRSGLLLHCEEVSDA